METSQIAFAVGILVFLATLLTLYAIFRKPLNLKQRLNREEVKDAQEVPVSAIQKQLDRVLRPMGEWLPRSPADMSRQERSLVRAGIRRKDAVILLNGAHLPIALLALAVFATTGHLYHRPILFVLISIIIGAAIPDIWLKRRIERRKINIQHGLPDAMDLAVISVEAGLGLDQALLRMAQEIRSAHPDLADERHLRNDEINMGHPRPEPLRNLPERTGEEDVQALFAILIP